MSHSPLPGPARASSFRWIWTPFLLLCLIAAAAALRRILALATPANPSVPQMAALDADFVSHTALTLAHIVPALLFILLLPFWFLHAVRRNPQLLRVLTIALFALGAIIGITAIPMSCHPVGGINEASAALLFDAFFLFSLGRSIVLYARRRFDLHRTWMMRAIAILLGIATTRPVMGVFFATQRLTHLTPDQFFGTAFWIGFTTTYIAGEAFLRSRNAREEPLAA